MYNRLTGSTPATEFALSDSSATDSLLSDSLLAGSAAPDSVAGSAFRAAVAETDTFVHGANPTIKVQTPIAETLPDHASGLIFAPGDSIRLRLLARQLAGIDTSQQQVRIFYYGDSQLETDHITATIRRALQERFGGKGPGLLPPDQYYNLPHQLVMSLSGDWQIWLTKDQPVKNKSIIFRNTLSKPSADKSWFRVGRTGKSPAEDYRQVRLFVYSDREPQVELLNSGQAAAKQVSHANGKIYTISATFDQTPADLKMVFTDADSLYVTGISLESPSGVFVDNVALRGLAFPGFTGSDQASLKQQFGEIKPAMFILQYGVNVVPSVSNSFGFFQKQFAAQVGWLRRNYPDTPVLVIGVSDMAHRVDGKMVSYSNIHRIKQIQFEIAMANGCLFWDLEQFMGGPGSMVQWVDTLPALARKDYVHFSEQGAAKVGGELSRLLIKEFELP